MQFKSKSSLCIFAGAALMFAPFAVSSAAASTDLDLVCSGSSFSQDGSPFSTTESVYLRTKNDFPMLSGTSGFDDSVKTNVISNNLIQIKFSAMGMTGEYYRATGDLFLIHDDGKLTKFLCKPKQ